MLLLLRDTFWYVDLIQLWTWMTRITHLVMDDLVPSDFSTYHTSDAILGHISVLVEICKSPLICMINPFMRYMSIWWSIFILRWFPSGAFLDSFSQAHTLWYYRDSLMELSQAHRLPCYHFNGVHVRSLIHPHWVILESSGQTRYRPDVLVAILGYIFLIYPHGKMHQLLYWAYFPLSVVEMIIFSRSCCRFLYLAEGYLFALLVTISMIYAEMSLQRSLTFGFWLSHYLWLFSRSLCWGNDSFPSGPFFLRLANGSFLWDDDRFLQLGISS